MNDFKTAGALAMKWQPQMNKHAHGWNGSAGEDAHRRCALVGCLLLLLIGSAAGNIARGQSQLPGDLFSEISMSETVASVATKDKASGNFGDAVLGGITLTKLLSSQGIESSLQTQTVVIDLSELDPQQANSTSAALRLNVDAEGERIDVVLPLQINVTDTPASDQTIRKLLVAVTAQPNVQLIMADTHLALHSSISNRNVSADRVREVASRLITAAAQTKSVLDSKPAAAAMESTVVRPPAPAVTAPAVTAPAVSTPAVSTPAVSAPAVSAPSETSLVGTWSAKTSATEAWAIRFSDDNSFALVHNSGTKSSVSRGQFSATAGQLRLSESSGVALNGLINRTSANAFSWALQDTNGRSLATLEFKKQ